MGRRKVRRRQDIQVCSTAERRVCHVPRQNSTFGDRSFAAAGPRIWNELPFSLRERHWAIAYYFQRTSENVLILRRICDIYYLFAPSINVLTYLLTKKQCLLHLLSTSRGCGDFNVQVTNELVYLLSYMDRTD